MVHSLGGQASIWANTSDLFRNSQSTAILKYVWQLSRLQDLKIGVWWMEVSTEILQSSAVIPKNFCNLDKGVKTQVSLNRSPCSSSHAWLSFQNRMSRVYEAIPANRFLPPKRSDQLISVSQTTHHANHKNGPAIRWLISNSWIIWT